MIVDLKFTSNFQTTDAHEAAMYMWGKGMKDIKVFITGRYWTEVTFPTAEIGKIEVILREFLGACGP